MRFYPYFQQMEIADPSDWFHDCQEENDSYTQSYKCYNFDIFRCGRLRPWLHVYELSMQIQGSPWMDTATGNGTQNPKVLPKPSPFRKSKKKGISQHFSLGQRGSLSCNITPFNVIRHLALIADESGFGMRSQMHKKCIKHKLSYIYIYAESKL